MDGKILYPEVATSLLESKTLWSGYIMGPSRKLCANYSGVHWISSPFIPSPNFLVMSGNAALLVIAFVVKLYAFRLDNNSKNLAIINFKNNYFFFFALGLLNGENIHRKIIKVVYFLYYIRLLYLCATYFVLYSFLFFTFYFIRNIMRFS